MKFLPNDHYYNNIVPLNIFYSNQFDFNTDDILTIVYKDIDTDKKSIYHIYRPEIEVYIVKPEYRTFNFIKDWIEIDKCDVYKVHYRNRWSEIGKIMNMDKDAVKKSPYIFGADVDIENYYLIQFRLEYPTDKIPKLSKGFLDIENDIINTYGFPQYGETPINIVSYMDASTMNMYTFVLTNNNMRDSIKEKSEYHKQISDKFDEDVKNFDKDRFIDSVHQEFDEEYPDVTYHVLLFDNEIEMIESLFKVIHASENDYVDIWNAPYDMMNLLERPRDLGKDPKYIVSDRRMYETKDGYVELTFKYEEDTNPVAHKRSHKSFTNTLCRFEDQMVIYAGIRSQGGKIPSLKLNAIAETVLSDKKLDFSEEAGIKYIFYRNFEKSIMYNIKDVLLLYGIEEKTKDLDTIFARQYSNMVFPNEAFTTTKVVRYSFLLFAMKEGFVLGNNRNKYLSKEEVEYMAERLGINFEDLENGFNNDLYEENDSDEEEEESDGKKEKYQGAFVMNPLYMSPTGTKILGKDAKYVHDFVGDEDIGSEYPTGVATCNISNETLVGKVILEDPDDVDIPIYSNFTFLGDELKKYKMNPSNHMMETYNEKQYIEFGKIFLDLPDISEIVDIIEENINDLVKE